MVKPELELRCWWIQIPSRVYPLTHLSIQKNSMFLCDLRNHCIHFAVNLDAYWSHVIDNIIYDNSQN